MYKNRFFIPGTLPAGLLCAGWLAFILLFLLSGALGHDPWKQDETYSFGIIYHFYTTHSWLVPVNAGVPFMEKPPLYYWTATLMCRLFAGVLPLHDAARLASVFYMIITCLSVFATSQILYKNYAERRAMGHAALALLLGCLGLVRHAHDMFTDVALLAGTSVALLGMALIACRQEQWKLGAVVFGIGTGMTFLSKGVAMPAVLVMSGLLIIPFLPRLRGGRMFAVILIALLAASPFLFIWPYLLYSHSPELFHEWFWNNNIGRFLGFSVDRLGAGNSHGYMLYTVLWFAFPAFPLAVAALILYHRKWRSPEYLIPLTVSVIGLIMLLSSASARALYFLPLLPAFALLGAQALMRIPASFFLKWNLAVRLLTSAVVIIIITIWICLMCPGGPQPFAKLYGGWLPLGFLPESRSVFAYTAALCFIATWSISFRFDPRSYVDTARIWFCALAFLWGISNALLLPWVDETRSFRPVITDLNRFLSRPEYADVCIARHDLGESVAPMWEYFGKSRGLGPLEGFEGKSCPLLLIMTGKTMAPVSDPRWQIVWKGSRLLDDKDELQLYRRGSP